jgi:hypothetical protein
MQILAVAALGLGEVKTQARVISGSLLVLPSSPGLRPFKSHYCHLVPRLQMLKSQRRLPKTCILMTKLFQSVFAQRACDFAVLDDAVAQAASWSSPDCDALLILTGYATALLLLENKAIAAWL